MQVTDRLTLLNGDCLAVMRDMPDASVDAVVCDPPYGLSAEPDMAEVMRHWMAGDDYSGRFREGQNNCASHIVRQTRVVDADNAQAKGGEETVTFRINFNPLPVRVGPVELDHGRLLWKKEIDADRPGRSGEHLLVNERYGQLAEMLHNGQFSLRERQGHAACVGVCACCAKGVQSGGAILVRLDDNALTDAERSGGVVALGGTELTAVLTFDVTRLTAELRPAAGAEKLDAGFLLVRTERVGTSAAAGSLTPELEALRVGAVSDAANGAISVHFDFLERLENPIIEQKGFMGKSWDSFVPGPSVWREALRVLKPGGHLAAFFGTRTYDIGTLAIRLAGFEVRDQLAWVYGSGFPKSLNVSKAIDATMLIGGSRTEDMRRVAMGDDYEPSGRGRINYDNGSGSQMNGAADPSSPATPEAARWAGWGTALKPAWEPICLARKPLIGTVASNVLAHGTGGINVDGCRVGTEVLAAQTAGQARIGTFERTDMTTPERVGRFPANLIHDGSDEVLAGFPASSVTGKRTEASRNAEVDGTAWLVNNHKSQEYTDSGSAARFFYCAKASRSDRQAGNEHPTVKPTPLMEWLARLITPPGGLVLDPFMGSGSTGKACHNEGFRFVGIERDPDYYAMAVARIWDHVST